MNSGKSDILGRLKTLGACTGLSLVPTSTKFVLLFPWGGGPILERKHILSFKVI